MDVKTGSFLERGQVFKSTDHRAWGSHPQFGNRDLLNYASHHKIWSKIWQTIK